MLQAIRNLVGIAPKYESDKINTESGITLYKHDSYKGRTVQGIVKYLGPHCESGLQIGDYVFYSAYSGQLWSWKGELILFMEETDVLCKVDNLPDFVIPGLYFREKLNKDTNWASLRMMIDEWAGQESSQDGYEAVYNFAKFISERVDAYGAYFEAPRSGVIEQLQDAFKNSPSMPLVTVGEEVKPTNLDLYKDEKTVCNECGGDEKQMRDRSTTKIYYQCQKCGNIRDRQMYKDVEK